MSVYWPGQERGAPQPTQAEDPARAMLPGETPWEYVARMSAANPVAQQAQQPPLGGKMGYFDSFTGSSQAGDVPSYYNPYTNLSSPSSQTQPGQQAGQQGMPGRDTPTPGSKHGKGRRVRIQHPHTGEVREVDEMKAQHYIAKGGRIV